MATHCTGGTSGTAAVTAEIQAIVQSLKTEVAERLKRSLPIYHAISYRSQIVAGTNYFIKVVVGEADDYIHMRVFQPLPHSDPKLSLENLQTGKTLFDEIEYF
ncbi:cystatin-B-like [Rhincodon typus]|uniref:cystatin-B-like n=1 Tax=Rhincodon typus TaxID=259920 RepID=UPI00202EE331|nr:cystatin-B-like [Rhincodon typus]